MQPKLPITVTNSSYQQVKLDEYGSELYLEIHDCYSYLTSINPEELLKGLSQLAVIQKLQEHYPNELAALYKALTFSITQ
jgi:hypothetical protein